MQLTLLVLSILLGAFGQIFFKLGINKVGAQGMQFYFALAKNMWIYFGVVSYGVSFLLWMKVLQYYEISFVRPLTGTGYVVTFFLAVFLLGENFSPRRLIGTILITVGVVLMK